MWGGGEIMQLKHLPQNETCYFTTANKANIDNTIAFKGKSRNYAANTHQKEKEHHELKIERI